MNVHARIWGPHAGVRLAHGADRVFHCPSADDPTAGGKGARAQALGEHLQDGNGVAWEMVRVDAEARTELEPQCPGPGVGVDSLSRDAGDGCFLNSAPIKVEAVEGVSVNMRQGDA